ncbi:polycystin-1-like [Gigantopelta aegis]|uniref:polycystin-1-like n=1 Tax=Gigantopelta aegis TaxID=1735272 RepID=UPI001B889BC6|nr:polycystin-1-like [Gigantopelta aegis]
MQFHYEICCCGNSFYTGCSTKSLTCQPPVSCYGDKHICPLSASCVSSGIACSCAGKHGSDPCGDNPYPSGSAFPDYFPVRGTRLYVASSDIYTVAADIAVETGDVIGILTEGNTDVLSCDSSQTSQWTQNKYIFTNVASDRSSVIKKNFLISPNQVCHVSTVYASLENVSLPAALSVMDKTGVYMVGYAVAGRSTECEVTVQEDVADILWVFPTLARDSSITVEINTPITMVARINQGSDLRYIWEVDGVNVTTISVESSCPSQVVAARCSTNSSSIAKPFTYITQSFQTAGQVRLTIYNDVSSKEVVVVISIDHCMPIKGLQLFHSCSGAKCSTLVEVGVELLFEVEITAGVVDTYSYKIAGAFLSEGGKYLNHTFNTPGQYELVVNGSCGRHSMVATLTITAKIAAHIENFQFSTQGLKVVPVNEEFSLFCNAVVQIDAEVEVTFYLYASDTNVKTISKTLNTSSTRLVESVNDTYTTAGQYLVNVTITDVFEVVSISRTVYAVHKLTGISVDSLVHFILLDREIEFRAVVNSTSGPVTVGAAMLAYNWTFPGVLIQSKTSKMLIIQRQKMDVLGEHRITVSVDNRVSSVSGFKTVTVEQCVSDLRLSYNGPQHISNNITIIASHDEGTNVTFTFDFGDGRPPTQQNDSSLTTQYGSVGVFSVSVNASNDLHLADCRPASAQLTVYVMDNDTLILLGILPTPCIAINYRVTLSAHVINVDPQRLMYEWSLGNSQGYVRGEGKQNVTSWYSAQGMYNVSVMVNGVERAETTMCVQETIAGLKISTPNPAVVRTVIQVSVSVAAGSDLSYKWKVDITNLKCETLQCSVTKDQPGNYLVNIVAYNNISREEVEVRLIFQNLITSLAVLCSTCKESVYANTALHMNLRAMIAEGTNVSYVWDFGDGTKGNTSQVNHVFTPEGQYNVCATASNLVDKDVECVVVTAEDPITDLTLVSDTRDVESGSVVQLEAKRTSGSSIKYVWQCTGQADVTSVNQIFTTRLTTSQTYNCTVTASNHVTEQVVASITISVFVKITSLQIVHQLVDRKYGAALEVLSFEGKANTDFLVSYDWNVFKEGSSVCRSAGKNLSQKCSSLPVGKYSVDLTAKNYISTKTVSLTFEIIQRIVNPRMSLSAEFVSLSTDIDLSVVMDKGSNVTYGWSVEPSDSSTCTGNNDAHTCRFRAIGRYMVRVEVRNVLNPSAEILDRQITVQQLVKDVSITSSIGDDFQFLAFGTKLTFTPVTSQGSDLLYSWVLSFGSLSVASSDSVTLLYTFTQTGTYTIVLNISNEVSHEVKTTSIKVQQEILVVVLKSDKNVITTGGTVSLMAVARSGSDTKFEWIIDGQVQSTSLASLQKTFLSANVHTVTVMAYNKVSNASDQKNITVEDPLSGLEVANCSVVRPALVDTTLVASVSQGTGVSFTWAVETVRGVKKAYFGKTVIHMFDSAGSFLVELSAANQVSNTSIRCSMNVQGIVKISTIKINSDIKYFVVNETIYFVAIGENLGDTTFTWDFGNSEVASTKNSKYQRLFMKAATYHLTVTASNNVSQAVFQTVFTVHHLQCEIPDVSVVGESSRTVLKSRALQLEVLVDSKGCIMYNSKHIWKVYTDKACMDDMVSLGDTHITSPALKVKPRVLDYGKYCVMFTTMYEDTPVHESANYTLTVVASPLKAMIAGGSERRLPEAKDLLLDGSLSFDPDTLDDTSGLTYQWMCKSLSTSVFSPACPDLDSLPKVKAEFSEGSYLIELTVAAGNRYNSTQQTIHVLRGSVPMVTIECVSCKSSNTFQISPNQQVVLSGRCTNCLSNIRYRWQVEADGIQVPLDETTTTTGGSNINLVVRPNVLGVADTYTFSLNVTSSGFSGEGNAILSLESNKPPSGGSCVIGGAAPVVSLESPVDVSCSGWTDDSGGHLYYQILVDGTVYSTHVLYHGTRDTQSVYVAPLSATTDRVKLQVKVIDELGAASDGGEKTIQFEMPTLNSSKTDYLVRMADTELRRLVRQNKPMSLLQYAIALSEQLNHESDSGGGQEGEVSREKRAVVRDAITLSLIMIPVNSLSDVQQMAYLLRLLTKYSDEYQTASSHMLIVKVLENIVQVLQSYAHQGLDWKQFVSHRLMSTISNLITAVNLAVYSPQDVSSTSQSGQLTGVAADFVSLRSEIHSFMSGMPVGGGSRSAEDELHRRQVVPRVFRIAEQVMSTSLMTTVLTEQSLVFSLGGIDVYGQRTKTDSVWRRRELLGCMFSLSDTLFDGVIKADQEIFQVMFVLSKNPYTWGSFKDFTITSNVPALSFKYSDGSSIKLADLPTKDKIKILMFRNDSNYTLATDNLIASPHYQPLDTLTYSGFTLKSKRSKKVVVDVSRGQSQVSSLHIQIRVSVLQNETEAENGVTPTGSVSAYLGVNYEATETKYEVFKEIGTLQMADGVDHRTYTFFIPSLTFDTASSYSVSVFNNNGYHDVNLSAAVYFSSCQYFAATPSDWSVSGCEVLDESIPICSVCLCDHLTSFGGSVLVPLDAIDFADLARLDLAVNPVVITAVGIILAVYIIIVIFSYYWDRADLSRISVIPLCGKNGSHKYEVTIITGRLPGAGTTAHVGIKLYGQLGKSEPRHLSKTDIPAFQRNCSDKFFIATDTNLGDLWKILVWHDNTGLSPSWYLHRIEVIDLLTDMKYYFLVDTWLSVEQENGILQKEISVAGADELKRFSSTLKTATYEGLADRHIWLSVFNRHDNSRFTRVQRATCCVTIVFVFMLVDAMWYGLLKDRTDAQADVSWSSFSWEEVVIGLVSNTIVFPVALVLILIFKKSRSQKNMFRKPQTAQTIEIPCDISQYSGSLRCSSPHADWESYYDGESTVGSVRAFELGSLHRSNTVRRVSEDSEAHSEPTNTTKKSSLQSIRRTHELMWSHDNILRSWPEKVPAWSDNLSSADPPSTSKSDSKKKSKKKDGCDSDDEFQQRLDKIDQELEQKEKKQQAKDKTTSLGKPSTKLAGKNDIDLFSSDDEWAKSNPVPVKKSKKMKTPPYPAGATASRVQPRQPPTINDRVDDLGNVDDILYSDDELSTDKKTKSKESTQTHRYNSRTQRERKFSSSSGAARKASRRMSHGTSSLKETASIRSDRHPGSNSEPDSRRESSVAAYWRRHSSISQSMRPRTACSLPPWCVYIGYMVCTLLSTISIIVILLYGYNFGRHVAIKWLLSIIISFLFSVFIIEPVKVLVLAVYLAVVSKNVHEDHDGDSIDVLPTVQANEQIKDVRFRPLGGFALLQAREKGMKICRMHVMLRQVVLFSFLLTLLLAICYINFPHSAFVSTQYVKHRLTDSPANLRLGNLKNIPDVQGWMQSVLAETIHHQELHTEEFPLLLGVTRLRQIRSITDLCPAASDLNKLKVPFLTSDPCEGSMTFKEDTARYGLKWQTSNNLNAPWPYSSAEETNTQSKFGHAQLYSGGGYVVMLGTSYNETRQLLQDIFSEDWMNLYTRAVFVEFTLYSMAEDLASSVSVLLEFPLSGGVLTSVDVLTQRLMWYDGVRIDPVMVCEVLFMACVVYLIVHLILTMVEEKSHFITSVWNWLDVVIVTLSVSCVGLYVACIVVTTNTFHDYFANRQMFTSFDRPSHLHEVLCDLHAWLLFLIFIKIVRQLRFIKCFHVYDKTLANAVGKLLGCTLIFVIMICSYAQLGYLIYGSTIRDFASFHTAITTLLRTICGAMNLATLLEFHPVLTPPYFYSFYALTYGVFIGLVMAVLNDTYRMTRQQMYYKATLEAQDYEMIDFMMNRFKLWAGIKKQRPAFQRVKFKGQPSLPSRSSSSARSSQSTSTSSSDQLGLESAALYKEYLMDKMQPQWENVLSRFQSIVKLDKDEEQQMKKLEKEIKDWTTKKKSDEKIKQSRGKTSQFRTRFQSNLGTTAVKNPKELLGRKSVTPPNVSPREPTSETGGRPHSDQCDRVDTKSHQQSSSDTQQMGNPSHSKNVHFSKQAW